MAVQGIAEATTTTVLVVEDEPVASALLKEFLAYLGFNARFAANGREATALMEARSPDVMLLDLKMPGMDGVELLRWARGRWPQGLPCGVIVLTGLKEESLLQQALELGASDVLQKPITLEMLELAVRVQLTLRSGAQVARTTPSVWVRPSPTILLLEDSDDLRALMKWTLKKGGYSVLEAKNGDEAFRTCLQRDGAIDLIIADVVVPGINGLDLAVLVQHEWPQIKVMLCTGDNEAFHRALTLLKRETPFLKKPFQTETLLHRVQQTLGSPETQ